MEAEAEKLKEMQNEVEKHNTLSSPGMALVIKKGVTIWLDGKLQAHMTKIKSCFRTVNFLYE